MTDELRNQIRKLDPMHPDVPVTPINRSILEDIMTSTTTPANATPARRTRWLVAVAAAAVALAVAISVPALTGDDPEVTTAGPPIVLSLGDGPGLASCLAFDTTILPDGVRRHGHGSQWRTSDPVG